MAWLKSLGDRIRAILIVAALIGVVLLDSVSRIISMCADGFLAVIILVLVLPMLKRKTP